MLAILFVAAVRSPSLEQSRYVGWLARALYAYVFLCLGFIVYKYKEDILYGRWKFVLYLLAALSLACKLIFWDRLPEIDIRTMYFGHIERYYTFFLSISGIALVFAVALLISRCGVIARVMCYLGEKSFHIMCLHMLGFFIFVELPFSVLGLNILHVPGPWSNIIFFTGGLFFSLVVIAIVDRVKAYMARD